MRSPKYVAVTALALVALAAAAAPADPAPAPVATSTNIPGTVLGSRPVAQISETLRPLTSDAVEFTYRSTGLRGPSTVSAMFFAPNGTPPSGGWPLVAYAHGTTGVLERCAPSLQPGMYGSTGTVAALLKRGWAVVATDYQGLGTPGPFPYLNAKVLGSNVLDSVRAARKLDPEVSPNTVLLGVSQGGQATEWATEHARSYAPELRIVGNAMIAPALTALPLVDAIDRGILTQPQYTMAPLRVRGVQISAAPDLNPDHVLHGIVAASAPALLQCVGEANVIKDHVAKTAGPADVAFSTNAARNSFVKFFVDNDLPQRAHPIPSYISRGTADVLVSSAWIDGSVAKMCRMGISVHQRLRPGGHMSASDLPAALGWIDAALRGTPPGKTC